MARNDKTRFGFFSFFTFTRRNRSGPVGRA